MNNQDIATCSFLDFLKASFHSCGMEEFIVYVFILTLLQLCMEEFIYFRFQVSVWNLDFVRVIRIYHEKWDI